MLYFADFHCHSKYSRAVSPRMDLEGVSACSKDKGLNLIGTGDFTYPAWFKELKSKLTDEGNGFFSFNKTLFALTTEVALIYSHPTGVKKVHLVVHSPSFEIAGQLNDVLSKRANLSADGRPIIGKTPCPMFTELCMEISKQIVIVPAHAWTPWFSVFGSNSGFDSLEEAFEDQAKNIFAIETGMSSDPAMNWRVPSLDKITLMSNSDAHGPAPNRIGRECNVFDFNEGKLSYSALFDAVRKKQKDKFLFTVEVNPSYGKYHVDGHRVCKFSSTPEETKKLNGICPVCKRPLTIGVLNRVEELAKRPEGFVLKGAIPFKAMLPLQELLAVFFGVGVSTKKVDLEYRRLLKAFGTEFTVLLDVGKEKLDKVVGARLAEIILLNREGKVQVKPGFDGEYGVPMLDEKSTGEKDERQKALGAF